MCSCRTRVAVARDRARGARRTRGASHAQARGPARGGARGVARAAARGAGAGPAPVPPPQDADDTLRKEIGNGGPTSSSAARTVEPQGARPMDVHWRRWRGVHGPGGRSGVLAGASSLPAASGVGIPGRQMLRAAGRPAGALELLAENQPVVGHAYETLHMLGAAAKIAGGSGAAQSSLNSIRIVQVEWGSVRSGHSGIFKGYNLIIGEGANVYTIESTFGEILNWKPDWLITRDLLFAAGVERLDQPSS